MRRVWTLWVMVAAFMVVAGACGTDAAVTDARPTAATTAESLSPTDATYARPTEPSTTSTTLLTTFATVTTTTTTPATVTTTTPAGVPTLADGRPTTWLGVTSDYVAVEVSTATGSSVHRYGQTGTRAEVDSATELGPNVITAVWRLRDGSMVGLVDCCEPAGGSIYYVVAGGSVDTAAGGSDGWTLAASPSSPEFARLGYLIGVFDPTRPGDDRHVAFVDEPHLGFPSGQATWSVDGTTLYWIGIEFEDGRTTLNRFELTADQPEPVVVGELNFVEPGQFLGNLATQASGNIVSFLHTQDDAGITASRGVVFNPSGELLVSFSVETGSLLGSYDASGKFLIYVDGDGIVRWQGGGESGELGAGYIHASW